MNIQNWLLAIISISIPVLTSVQEVDNTKQISNDHPQVSPDGKRIVFDSNRTGDREIFVMNLDGSEVQQLTFSEGHDGHPAWSPDGKKLVFESDRNKNLDIYILDLGSFMLNRITYHDSSDLVAHWSIRGIIAFQSRRAGNTSIWTVNEEGKDLRQLTTSEYSNVVPRWSTDGSKLVFSSNRDGNWEIYKMN